MPTPSALVGHPGAADPEDGHEREAGGDGERLAGALGRLIGLDLIALVRVERGVLRSLIHGRVQDGGLAERAHGLIGAIVDGVGVQIFCFNVGHAQILSSSI